MKRKKTILIAVLLLATYPALYAGLRLSKCLVRQEFLCFSCSEQLLSQFKTEYPAALDISTESERNQIGCGRIQKCNKRFGESVLVPCFTPLGELEMKLRGFNTSTMYVINNVNENAGSEGTFLRQTILKELSVTREQQGF